VKKLKPFDRYHHYLRAVQSPEADCEFISDTYKELRGRRPRVLREDFCGTFAICCEWVKLHRNNRAIGIDLDPEPLSYGQKHYLSKLKEEQKKRIRLVQGSVLTVSPPKADVALAMNFSFYFFKSRLMLRQYFTRARRGLKRGGVLIVDCFGGQAAMEPNVEKTKIGGFHYFWDQVSFNPITHEALFHIHFKRQGEPKREKVFTYDWRMWTIPEIRECMTEAGFRRTHVYWEGVNRAGNGNGIFKRSESGDNESEGYVAYVVGEL